MNAAIAKLPITFSFIFISCFISAITWFGDIPSTLYWFIYSPSLIEQGQIWRLITPIFLHFPAMGIIFAHLAFNMIWLHEFGKHIERSDSSLFLLVLILISGTISTVAQSYVSTGIFGGMSGVVYALLGYLFIRSNCKPYYRLPIQNNLAYVLIAIMAASALGVFGDDIGNTAHIVGFLCGIAIGIFKVAIAKIS